MKRVNMIGCCLLLLTGSTMISSCKKIANGYLSDHLRYINSLATITRGSQSSNSDVINPDGSTAPILYQYSNLRNKETNQPVSDSFFRKYPVATWKTGMSYVWATDTSEALINAKRDTQQLVPLSFNEKNGAWHANAASLYLPLGDYTFDINASNVFGSKYFPDFGTLRIKDLDASSYWSFVQGTYSPYTYHYKYSGAPTGSLPANTGPTTTCERISPEGHLLYVKVVDMNGVPFDPATSEVRYYSKTNATYPSLEYFSKIHPVTYADKQYVIDYFVAPFPYKSQVMWFYLIKSYTGLNSAIPASYMYALWSVQWQIKELGTYQVTIQFTNLIHV